MVTSRQQTARLLGYWVLNAGQQTRLGVWEGEGPTITLVADGDTMVVVVVVRNLADSTCLSIADYRLQSAYAQDFTPARTEFEGVRERSFSRAEMKKGPPHARRIAGDQL